MITLTVLLVGWIVARLVRRRRRRITVRGFTEPELKSWLDRQAKAHPDGSGE